MNKLKTFKFNKEERVECLVTIMYVVEATSLASAKKLVNKGQGESVGIMFTESVILKGGEFKYVKHN